MSFDFKAVGNFLKTSFGNPFSASVTMEQRGKLAAVGGLSDMFIPRDSSGDIVPLNSGIAGAVSKAIDFSTLLLFIPGIFAGPLAPLGAAIFGLALLNASAKVINYGAKLLGSIFSLDLEGVLTNGLATAGAAICLLPVGKLFSQGLSKTISGIKTAASKIKGSVFRKYTVGGANYLYGTELSGGVGSLLSPACANELKTAGQGLLGLGRRGFKWLQAQAPIVATA